MTEKSLLVNFIGNYPQVRVLDYFIENDIFDHSIPNIIKGSDVSRNTLEPILKLLLKSSLIKKTRKIGKAQLFNLNKESPLAQRLLELDYELIRESISQIEKEIKIEA